MVKFNEEKHLYQNLEGENYISCSTIVGLFENKFNRRFWGVYKALEEYHGESFKKFKFKFLKNKTEEAILQLVDANIYDDILTIREKYFKQWDEENLKSRIKGNKLHLSKEHKALKDKHVFFEGSSYNTIDFKSSYIDKNLEELQTLDYYKDLPDGYYPELLIFNHELKLAGTSDRVFIITKDDERYIVIDDWKGLALDTPIATKEGWSTIGELKRGDEIFDGNGNITKIKNLSEIHYNPCYKITFDTNDEIVCDHEHKWVIEKRIGNKLKEYTLTTEEIFNQVQLGEIIKIKCTDIKTDKKQLPIDPYVLGLWLADGNRTCGTITCVNDDIWDEVHRRGYETSINHNRNTEKGAESRTVFGLRGELRKLKLLKNKHIPDIYLRSSYDQRLDLLRGFMDGDGYFNRSRNRNVMSTTKEWQANAIIQLTSSLGMKPIRLKANSKGFFEKFEKIDICFSTDINPFLARNKDYNQVYKNTRPGYSTHRNIKKIEKIDTVPTRCLEVESPDHTYLVGYSFIKTHNTNKVIKTENKYEKMLFPLNHLDDCNKSHYEVQISLYGYLLEQMGFRVLHTRFTHIDDEHVETVYEVNYSERRKDIQYMINEFKEVYPFCKEYFKQLISTDKVMRLVIYDLITNLDANLSNEIGDLKFHEDKLKDNTIKYIVKDFILTKRNEIKI